MPFLRPETSIDFRWQGQWNLSTGFVLHDTVFNDGSSYICTVPHTSSVSDEPGTGASWTTYWDLVAQKGADGEGGGGGAVTSVFTRTGDVVAVSGDYSIGQITGAGALASLNEIANAQVSATAAIAESKLALNFATHSNANDPSSDQKAALAGTNGAPSVSNRYVTDSDPRNTDARTPLGHTHTLVDVTDSGALAGLDSVGTAQITDDSVTLAKLANVATSVILGRVTAATGDPEALTPAQARTVLGTGALALLSEVNNAQVGASAAIVESKLALNFATHSNANDPSAGEKLALAGTSGIPSGVNQYVTNVDPRNSDARTPTAHTHGTSDIDDNAVTLAKLLDIATASFLGRATAATGDPEVLTVAQARTLLGTGALALLNTVATAQIDNSAVTLAKMANMATASILGRNTAGSGAPEVLSAATVRTILGTGALALLSDITNSQVNASAAIAESKLSLAFTTTYLQKLGLWRFLWDTSKWYYATSIYSLDTTTTLNMGTSGTIFFEPIYIPSTYTITKFVFQCTTVGTSSNARAALYSDNGGPDSLLVETANESTTTTGIKQVTVSYAVTNPGWHWLAFRSSGGTYQAVDGQYVMPLLGDGTGVSNLGSNTTGYTQSGAFGAFPSTASPSGATTSNLPLVALERAA